MKKKEFKDPVRNPNLGSDRRIEAEGIKVNPERKLVGALPVDKFVMQFTINCRSFSYRFVFDNIEKNLGYKPGDLLIDGATFLHQIMHPEDRRIVEGQVSPQMFEKISEIEDEELNSWEFSYNFRLRREGGDYISFLQRFVVEEREDDADPKILSGVLFEVENYQPFNKITFSSVKKSERGIERFASDFPIGSNMFISKREKEVVGLLVKGLSSKQIAEKLFISTYTVNNHRQNLLRKTLTSNTAELINKAIGLGLV